MVIHFASEEIEIHADHQLLASTLLRSQALPALHETVHAHEIADVARDRLERI